MEGAMKIKRRQFLFKTAAGLGGIMIASDLGKALNQPDRVFNPYEMVPLGKTGLVVSRIGLGTGTRGGNRESNQTRLGKEPFSRLLRESYERGVRLFDMADIYGSHSYIMPALEGISRDRYMLVSKIWFRQRGIPEADHPSAEEVVKRFLQEINCDYIDLLLLHCVISETWNQELQAYMDALDKLKRAGVIRAHGVSCHSLGALQTAVNEPWVESVHARINAYGDKMDGTPEQVVPVLKQMHDAGKGVIGMKLIAEGMYRDDNEKRNRSLEFVLNLGSVDALVVGCESLQEIDDLAKRVSAVTRKA
jgi:aryl-alcohol dehydrogenase-like predicted oxidoreductase